MSISKLGAICLWSLLCMAGFVAGLGAANAQSSGVQPVPALTSQVVDTAGVLNTAQAEGLRAQLASLEAQTGAQVVVLTVATTAPEDIFSYSNRVAQSWKLGRADVGDGVLVVLATVDKRIRIEVARSLEGAIPDLMAKRVIDEAMVPQLRAGRPDLALSEAGTYLGKLIAKEDLPPPNTLAASGAPAGKAGGFEWVDLAIFMFVAVPIAASVLRAMVGKALSTVATGALTGVAAFAMTSAVAVAALAGVLGFVYAIVLAVAPKPVRSNRRRGAYGAGALGGLGGFGGGGFGGRGGGFGSGGFGSGGGGGFGGGGASGGW